MKRTNPLLNRVRRHANFSTLFHTVQPAPQTATAANVARVTTPAGIAGYQERETAVSHDVQRAIDVAETGAMPSLQPTSPAMSAISQPPPAEQSNWQRLQRITQAHQQKTTDTPAATPTAKEAAAPIQAAPQTAVPVVQPKTGEEANWQRLQSIFNAHQQKTTAAAEPQADTPPAVASTPADTTAAPDVSRAIETAEAPLAPVATTPSKPRLEEAWPVRRRSGSPPPAPAATTPPIAKPQERPVLRVDPAETAAVQTRLDKITPGRPTASSVELHLPNRPRPTAAPANVQPKRDTAQPAAPPPLVTADKAALSTPTVIPTEIGLLPADMWDILGDTPPASDKSSPTPAAATSRSEPDQPSPTTVAETAVQRAIATAEASTATPATAVSPTSAVPLIPAPAAHSARTTTAPETAAAATSPRTSAITTTGSTPAAPAARHIPTPPTSLTNPETVTHNTPTTPAVQRTPAAQAPQTTTALQRQMPDTPSKGAPPAPTSEQSTTVDFPEPEPATPQTAATAPDPVVTTPPSQPDHEAIQRAVLTIEAAAPTADMPSRPTRQANLHEAQAMPAISTPPPHAPLTTPGTHSTSPVTPPIVQKKPAATSPPSSSIVRLPDTSTSPRAQSAAPDATLQRAVAAAEMPAAPTADSRGATPQRPTTMPPSTLVAAQRAAVQAEQTPVSPTQSAATAVSQPSLPYASPPTIGRREMTPATATAVQRAIATAEAPAATAAPQGQASDETRPLTTSHPAAPQTPTTTSRTAPPTPPVQAATAAAAATPVMAALQRQTMAGQTPPATVTHTSSSPTTSLSPIAPSSPTTPSRAAATAPVNQPIPQAIQRAIAAAETPATASAPHQTGDETQPLTAFHSAAPQTPATTSHTILPTPVSQAASTAAVIQRQTTAGQIPPAAVTHTPSSPTAPPSPTTPSRAAATAPVNQPIPQAIQRAIAAAEAPVQRAVRQPPPPLPHTSTTGLGASSTQRSPAPAVGAAPVQTGAVQTPSARAAAVQPTTVQRTAVTPTPIAVINQSAVDPPEIVQADHETEAVNGYTNQTTAETAAASLVQRAPGGQSVAASANQTQETAVDISEPETAADIDVDQLARLVYRQLQRRLSLERERGRGRFK